MGTIRRLLLSGTVALLLLGGVTLSPLSAGTAHATAGDVGYADQSSSGSVNPPTSDKPQSKLWFTAGTWWADMFDTVSKSWHIFRLDRSIEQWVDTGTRIDDRANTLGDALWDGSHLYVASHVVTTSSDHAAVASTPGSPARLYRYSFSSATSSYSLDAGFPVAINNNSSESITLDKDSSGTLWATWTRVSGSSAAGFTNAVYVNSTSGGDASWGTPFVLPVAGAAPAPDDISAVVAYGKSRVGVMWSNQLDDTVYWAVHKDGDAASTWNGSVAVRGSKQPDDHMNLKTLQADATGRVFAAVKTSLDTSPTSTSSSPQVNLLVFKPGTGAWSSYLYGTLADCHTRPLVMLDDEHSVVHVFATAPTSTGCPYSGAPGTIYEKSAPLDNPVFPAGRGTPLIRDAASENMNDVTSSKQSVSSGTGLVVLASNQATGRYWHADESLSATGTVSAPTASFTATPTSGPAPLAVQLSDTSSGNPTSWAWAFGDGTTSTAQSPSHTYAAAGNYTVTLTASNSSGSGVPASRVISVAAPAAAGSVAVGGTTTAGSAATTGVTLTKPVGTTAGDLLVASFTADLTPTASTPAGWTSFVPRLTPGSGATLFGYYHVVTAADDGVSGWTWTLSSAQKWNGGVTRFTGVNTSAPFDTPVASATDSNSAALSVTVPSVTTVTAGALLIGGLGADGSTPTTTPPSGWSQPWESTGQQIAEQAYRAQATPGSSGSPTWSISAGRALAAWLVALRPR